GLRHVGAFNQLGAGLDGDREAAQLGSARIAPGFAGADVVFPCVPGAADHLALARIAIAAGLRGGYEAGELAFGQRAALVWAAIRYRKELAVEIENDKPAPLDLDELRCPRREITRPPDHVFRHGVP